jgi:hypothetical protein
MNADGRSLLTEAACRDGEGELSALLGDVCDALDVDADDALGESAIRDALVRAYLLGAKAGAVEHAAQCIARGIDLPPLEFDFTDPAG